MKEITRRLYTKPVMLGMAFFVGMALVAALFITSKSRAAQTTFVPAGDDQFETLPDGETYHNFSGNPIPQGFFNFDGKTTSNAYSGTVPLEGDPQPGDNNIDTVIHRNQDVFVPGSTSIQIAKMSLKSSNPITVTYSDRASELWQVNVGLSAFHASTGTMTFNSGGTFDSSLGVYPKFTFTRVSDGAQKVLDTGGSGGLSPQSGMAMNTGGNAAPVATATIAPCKIAVNDFQTLSKSNRITTSAATSTGCAPVNLTSTNSPWPITQPISEQELLASHRASPPGTKQALAK